VSANLSDSAEVTAAPYDFSVLRQLRKRQDLTIGEVSRRCGVSPAVISRLERNLNTAELMTLFRLARVFGMNAADLLSLAESRTAHRTASSEHRFGGFHLREVDYANVRCLYGTAGAGARITRPEIHQNDYELCWVIEGCLEVTLPDEKHRLSAGDAIQFDAILEHSYEALEGCRIVILHLTKPKRF
jgi:mannose-6-phosphate isomerase-like protein (cupin superfamily)